MLKRTAMLALWMIGPLPALADATRDCTKLSGKAALPACDKAIKQNPGSAELFFARARAYNDVGEKHRAISDYTSFIALDPNNPGGFINRGNAYRDTGDLDRAIADYTMAIAHCSSGRCNVTGSRLAYLNRGLVHSRKGDFDKAIADFDMAIEVAPKDGALYFQRSIAYEKKGDKVRAEADKKRAAELGVKSLSPCFFTTACCEIIGLADNCFELTALRRFRDIWLAKQPGGSEVISRYYERAPVILAAIQARGEKDALLHYYVTHILPAAISASAGWFRLTNVIYSDLIERLEVRYQSNASES